MMDTNPGSDTIDCRNAIDVNTIGLEESVKRITMTDKLELSQKIVTQNGNFINQCLDLKNITNGNIHNHNNDEEIVHHFECSKNSNCFSDNDNSFKDTVKSGINCNNSVDEHNNNCISSVDVEHVVIAEEIGQELVISEEQVIYGNEDNVVIRTNDNSVSAEDIYESEIVTNNEMVCTDMDGENSSLSESSSRQSSMSPSVSQTTPTPISLSNTAMSVVESFITAATNSSTAPQLSDCTNSNSINKKKFGKFRILLGNNEQNKGCDENLNIESSEVSIHSEESSIDSRFDRGVAETLSGTQSESSLHDMSEHSPNASPNPSHTPDSKNSKQGKRRGRPAGSTKKEKIPIIATQLMLEDELNRRRSSRLKSLEERKEQERAVFTKHRDSDDMSCNSNLNTSDDFEKIHTIDSSNNIKQKKKKSKKDKTKKDKNKEKESEKKGKRKKRSSNECDENRKLTFDEQKPEKCKVLETYKNLTNIECFTAPLPPSHYANIKSNNTLLNAQNKNCIESDDSPKPEKVKSRWRRNSELESGHGFMPDHHQRQSAQIHQIVIPKETEPIPPYDQIDENIYLFERKKSKSKKETRRMVCDCILTKEERMRGLIGCGDDCLNRMLMIECGSRCSLGEHCANKRFQKKQNAKVEPFRTSKKGWGLRTLEPLQSNTFIMEYIGEVVDPLDFHNRVEKYSKEKIEHHYFMALKSDEIIDATVKGNITRFVNHSCDPNSETQKWTVNGELRIGFFTQRFVQAGEEITFDYQFQRYGKEAQKCYCDSSNCRGFIGATETVDIFTDGTKITPKQKLKAAQLDQSEEEYLEDLALEEEIAKLSEGGGLRSRQQVLTLARLMVRAEDTASRHKLISIIKGTIEIAYLRLLLDYHGLQLIWSWMVEVEDINLKSDILEVLEILPIPNKTMLEDSKVLAVVERWAKQIHQHISSPTYNSNQTIDVAVVETDIVESIDETIVAICDKKEAIIVEEIEIQANEELIKKEVNEETIEELKDGSLESQDVEEMIEKNDTEIIPPISANDASDEKNNDLNQTNHEISAENSNDLNETNNKVSEKISFDLNATNNVVSDEKSNEEICAEKSPIELNETNKEVSENKETQNEAQISTKSSPRIEHKNSFSMVIKPRSASISSKSEVPQTPVMKTKPNIASMAQKLLINWKELKEVFRIPRLERQKRHEDEKEADRRTKEVEERRARGLPFAFDKRGIDDRDYTIAGILGIKRKSLKRSTDGKDGPIKKISLQTSQQLSLSNQPVSRVSREEHRKIFEMEVAQRDYQEALKKYHQELATYNALYGPHIQAQQIYSQQETLMRDQYYNTYNSYDNFYQSEQNFVPPPNPVFGLDYNLTSNATNVEYMQTENEIISESNQAITDSKTIEIFNLNSGPVLIPLSNEEFQQTNDLESSLAIDNVSQNMIIYSDDIKEQNQGIDCIFDAIFPPPGVYYITPEGNSYFTAVPTDKKGVSVNTSVFDKNVIIPHSSSFTKTLANNNLPNNWRHYKDKYGNYYYYNKITRKSQWTPPEEQKQLTPPIEVPISSENDQKLSDNEEMALCEEQPQLGPLKSEPMDEPIDSCLDSVTADIDITDTENIINSSNNSPNLLQSIIALEADPRKRKQLLNSVMPSTTTAAADTSSSLPRKKSLSTRKIQENFRSKMSQYVIHCLNPYRKADCEKGRILNTDDFKYLARKLTHTIMGKEIKQCKSLVDLSCNEAVKHKTKDYVRKYMARFGTFYKTDNNEKIISPKEIAPNDTND